MTSDIFIATNNLEFDFIYIDGDHHRDFVPSVVTLNLTMHPAPEAVTVEVIPLGLASVEPQIPEPIACAGAAVMTLKLLITSRSESTPNLIYLKLNLHCAEWTCARFYCEKC